MEKDSFIPYRKLQLELLKEILAGKTVKCKLVLATVIFNDREIRTDDFFLFHTT